MADLTRRGLLTQMSIATGVGIVGGLGLRQIMAPQVQQATAAAAMPLPLPGVSRAEVAAPSGLSLGRVTLAGPMMVHVRDVSSGEVSVMVGTQELVYRDPELVSRLVETAASVNRAEA